MSKLTNLARVLFDKLTGEIVVGDDLGYDGEATIDQFVQPVERLVWNIKLSISGTVVMAFPFRDNGDGTFTAMNAERIQRISDKELQITFATPIKGMANILVASSAITFNV